MEASSLPQKRDKHDKVFQIGTLPELQKLQSYLCSVKPQKLGSVETLPESRVTKVTKTKVTFGLGSVELYYKSYNARATTIPTD